MTDSTCPSVLDVRPEVFITYQWDLQDTVKLLKNKLEESGFQCWMDIRQMGGGDSMFAEIDAGIRASKVNQYKCLPSPVSSPEEGVLRKKNRSHVQKQYKALKWPKWIPYLYRTPA